MGCGASRIFPGGRPSVKALRTKYGDPDSELGADPDATAAASKFLRSGASLKRIIETNSVLVVVRVRPLNTREKEAGSEESVKVLNARKLTCTDGQKNATDRDFSFDACFATGASQRDVYERSGRMVLGKVLEGFNGCVFAYGQTGSGKTFTMTGDEQKPGVIPRLCNELFERIGSMEKKKVVVRVAMCEIYNEKLHDLLHKDGQHSRDLQIREEPGLGGRGVFVDGLSEHGAESAQDVLALLEDGATRRAVGRTDMNEHSSRSHAVTTLHIETWEEDDLEKLTATESKLHLIDLAGSERQKGTGATGDRLKEGAQINLSLTALGNVISALTDKNRGHVPYRDSKLTRLLQDSLGGNSVTVMLCNASPAKLNADETVAALRFAERTKKIENVATINRDPKAARAAALYEENVLLRERCARLEAHVAELEKYYG